MGGFTRLALVGNMIMTRIMIMVIAGRARISTSGPSQRVPSVSLGDPSQGWPSLDSDINCPLL